MINAKQSPGEGSGLKLKGRIVRVNQIPKESISDTDSQTITIQYLKKDSKQIIINAHYNTDLDFCCMCKLSFKMKDKIVSKTLTQSCKTKRYCLKCAKRFNLI